MPSHSPPGVHFEEISTRSQPIKGVSTSITAFIGFTPKGIVAEPILISKLEDYTSEFGDIQSERDSMGLAVRAYYLNGGGVAYICRLASEVNSAADYMALYESTLHKYRDISIIVLPDEQMAEDGSGNAAINATLAHCERMESCTLIIDPPQGYELNDANAVRHLSLPASPYAVLYYPWVKMANPLNNSDSLSGADKNVLLPSSSIAAAIWGKTDESRGVWKPPAGLRTQLTAVIEPEYRVSSLTQESLNPLGINCIRNFPNSGFVLWGARTLAGNSNIEVRYISVHRTKVHIKESVYNGTRWASFEVNNSLLWSTLRDSIDSFLNGLYRKGAFQGRTEDQAYFVRCGVGETMTEVDRTEGRVIMSIGFAPIKPAEFIILHVQQKTAL